MKKQLCAPHLAPLARLSTMKPVSPSKRQRYSAILGVLTLMKLKPEHVEEVDDALNAEAERVGSVVGGAMGKHLRKQVEAARDTVIKNNKDGGPTANKVGAVGDDVRAKIERHDDAKPPVGAVSGGINTGVPETMAMR